MGMYHFTHLAGQREKKHAKRMLSKGRRRAMKKSCNGDESYSTRNKANNTYYDSWLFS